MSEDQAPYVYDGPPAKARLVSDDEMRWAEALQVERQHGDTAAVFVAERIGALGLAGDAAGVERWKA